MADVLFPFFLLGFLLIRIFIGKVFPSLTNAEIYLFLFWIPIFLQFLTLCYGWLGIKFSFIKDEAIALAQSLLIASIGAAALTMYMK